MFEVLGVAGIAISVLAYVPQVVHLGRERCSAGVSCRAWAMWLASSVLIGTLTLYRRDLVFILLQVSTLTSAAIILFLRASTGEWSAPSTRAAFRRADRPGRTTVRDVDFPRRHLTAVTDGVAAARPCASGWQTARVRRWDLRSLAPSSRKQTAREPGSDAPRVPRLDRQMPRVLFSSPECRVVVVDLANGEEIGDHRVRERAVVEVVMGRVVIESSGETAECDAGTLVTFDPGEEHRVQALADARLLLMLAPWPAAEHYTETEQRHGDDLPANAVVEPLPPSDTAA